MPIEAQCPAQIVHVAELQDAFYDKLLVRVFIHLREVDIPKQFLFFQCFHKFNVSYHRTNGNFLLVCFLTVQAFFAGTDYLICPIRILLAAGNQETLAGVGIPLRWEQFEEISLARGESVMGNQWGHPFGN